MMRLDNSKYGNMSQARAVEQGDDPRGSGVRKPVGSSGGRRGATYGMLGGFLPADHVDVGLAAPRIRSSAMMPNRRRRQRRCSGFPTTILLTLRRRRSARISSLTHDPLSVTVSAPSCSARRRVSATRARSASRSRAWAGVSTYATIHSARRVSAKRLAARTTRTECGLGPDAGDDALRDRPGRADGVIAHVVAHLHVHAVGGAAQGQLAEGDQVPLAEETPGGFRGLVRDVDLSFLEALERDPRGEGRSAQPRPLAPGRNPAGFRGP